MCALRVRVHNNSSFLEKNFSKIEKVLTIFSILEKMFPKIDDLMCSLRHTLTRSIYIYIYIIGGAKYILLFCFGRNSLLLKLLATMSTPHIIHYDLSAKQKNLFIMTWKYSFFSSNYFIVYSSSPFPTRYDI